MRALMFELENEEPLRAFTIQGKLQNISAIANNLVKNVAFTKVKHAEIAEYIRLAVVRDPVKRVLSAYSNRVAQYGELDELKTDASIEDLGLDYNPSVNFFFENIEKYMQVSRSIRRHCSHQEVFLGKDKNYYSQIFCLEKSHDLEAYLSDLTGKETRLPRIHESSQRNEFESLNENTKRSVLDYVKSSVIFEWFPHYREPYKDYI